jgi:putative FmdB family regulatory protein
MPFYEYQCGHCGHHLEVMQKISDAPLRKCPECSRRTLKKLVSAPVFRLKGSGWYETDFKSEKEEKRNVAGEKDEKPAETPPKPDAAAPKADAVPKPEKADATAKPAAAPPKPAPRRKAVARRRPAARKARR